jgi:hypothetical protein
MLTRYRRDAPNRGPHVLRRGTAMRTSGTGDRMTRWKIIIEGRVRYVQSRDVAQPQPRDGPPKAAHSAVARLSVDRHLMESSSLLSVGYDPQSRTLEVAFRNSGVYRYVDVPPEVYAQMLAAPSKGRFVNDRVKGRYAYRRV